LNFGSDDLPPVLVESIRSGRIYLGESETTPLHSNITLEEAVLLYTAVRRIKPTLSIEVGFAHGISTLAILKALEDNGVGTHHVMDPFQDRFNNGGLANVRAAGLEHRMVFHRKFAEEVIPQLGPCQFGFIDASHLFDLTLMEFILIDKKLDVGGLVGMHDMWMSSLQKVFRYINKNRAYRRCNELEAPQMQHSTFKSRMKQAIAGALRRIRPLGRLVSQEALHPWSEMSVPNLLLLEKTAADNRDWRFHSPF
jgi:predicted O-methyltransferase YrrM